MHIESMLNYLLVATYLCKCHKCTHHRCSWGALPTSNGQHYTAPVSMLVLLLFVAARTEHRLKSAAQHHLGHLATCYLPSYLPTYPLSQPCKAKLGILGILPPVIFQPTCPLSQTWHLRLMPTRCLDTKQ